MIWADRLPRLGGLVFLLLSIGVVVGAVLSMTVTSNEPFTRGDVRGYLQDIDSHRAAFILNLIASVCVDAVLGILAAATLFLLLRDRARALATAALVLIVGASAVSMVGDAVSGVLLNIARDFAHGGPPGVDAGSAQTLEVGRALGMIQGVAMEVGWTALSSGILLFGIIIAWGPSGAVNPPRWLGFVAVVSGVVGYLTWLVAVSDAAFVVFLVSAISQLVFVAGMGLWLLTRSEVQAAEMRAAAT